MLDIILELKMETPQMKDQNFLFTEKVRDGMKNQRVKAMSNLIL